MNPSHRTPRRRCLYCNEPFVANGSHQLYCSVDCYNRSKAGSRRTWKADFMPNSAAERSLSTAERVTPQPLRYRRLDGYVAVDANAFLEEITESERARPGHIDG